MSEEGRVRYPSYTANTLRAELDGFEAQFGMSSEEHVRRRYVDRDTPGVDGFDSHVWASIYDEWRRLSGRAG